MTRIFYFTSIVAAVATTAMAQTIPSELWGSWVVRRELHATTISCWGETEARAIIGTEIEYSADSFRWKDKIARHPTADVSVITAKQFHDENSGQGANSSQVSFDQLSIKVATAKQVTINHPGTTSELPCEPSEIPGDVVLLKDHTTIVFSVCNVYFEAKRVVASSPSDKNKDPHRPACTSAPCQKIESFLKGHFCGASPFGNGPQNGCDTRSAKQLVTGVNVIAAFDCEWSETDGRPKCRQRSEPSPAIRNILVREMRLLGLPARAEKEIYFTVWQPSSAKWFLAAADFGQANDSDLKLCQVIVVVDRGGQVHVLRKVQFQKTNADVPTVTTWVSPGHSRRGRRRSVRDHPGRRRLREPLARSRQAAGRFFQENFFRPWLLPVVMNLRDP